MEQNKQHHRRGHSRSGYAAFGYPHKSRYAVGKFISDIVLQVLSFVAENERENIKARQSEGIKIAKEKGVRFGRPSFVYTDAFLSVANDYLCKRIKLKTALQLLNIKQSNFYYHIRKIKTTPCHLE